MSSAFLVHYVTGDTKGVIRICVSRLVSMLSAVPVNYVTGDTKGVIRICVSKLVSMSSAFLVNYVTGKRQIINVKVDRRLSKVFVPENKLYFKKLFDNINVCMYQVPVFTT